MPYQIDGREIHLQDEPRNMSGPIYVPLRQMTEALGGKATWDGASDTAGANINGRHARVPNGSASFTVDGQSQSMSVPSFMDGSQVWVPIEFFGIAFGIPVHAHEGNLVTVDTTRARQAA